MANCENCAFYGKRLSKESMFLPPQCLNKSMSKIQFERAYNSVLSCPGFCRKVRIIPARGGNSRYET